MNNNILIKPYQSDRWKFHPKEDFTVYKKKPKTKSEIQKNKRFMQIIDNLPKNYFEEK